MIAERLAASHDRGRQQVMERQNCRPPKGRMASQPLNEAPRCLGGRPNAPVGATAPSGRVATLPFFIMMERQNCRPPKGRMASQHTNDAPRSLGGRPNAPVGATGPPAATVFGDRGQEVLALFVAFAISVFQRIELSNW